MFYFELKNLIRFFVAPLLEINIMQPLQAMVIPPPLIQTFALHPVHRVLPAGLVGSGGFGPHAELHENMCGHVLRMV